MTEPTAPVPAPPPKPRRRGLRLLRVLLWALTATVAVLIAAAAAVAWLGSESGLQWLAARTPLRLGSTQITLKDVQGSLWNSVRIGRLQLTTPSSITLLHDARLRWTPTALWQRTLHTQNLSAQRIDVTPTHAPASTGPTARAAAARGSPPSPAGPRPGSAAARAPPRPTRRRRA